MIKLDGETPVLIIVLTAPSYPDNANWWVSARNSIDNLADVFLALIHRYGLHVFSCINTNRRNILRVKQQKNAHAILVNLAVTLLLFYITFLIGGNNYVKTGGTCIALSACSLYFLLAAFGWMLVEGIVQYIKYVSITTSLPAQFVRKVAIAVWCK